MNNGPHTRSTVYLAIPSDYCLALEMTPNNTLTLVCRSVIVGMLVCWYVLLLFHVPHVDTTYLSIKNIYIE